MKPFFYRWATTSFAVFIAGGIVPGITYDTLSALLWAGLLLGILNAVVRPALMILSLPLIVLTLGLFIPFINAILLKFVGGGLISGFRVAGFGSALLGAIVISLVSGALNRLFKQESGTGGMTIRGSTLPPSENQEPREMKRVEGRVIE